MKPPLQHLVIKPTLACTADCLACNYRRTLHKNKATEDRLSLKQWLAIFASASRLGTWNLTISGGEPTLYPHLPHLIRAAKNLGWLVRLNTNGSLMTPELAQKLLEAGLDIIDVSLYSAHPEIHDTMRRSRGLWEKATSAVELLAKLQSSYSRFQVITQTIISKDNYDEFGDLIRLHHQLGSNGIVISYLEGDFQKKYLLDADEIEQFRKNLSEIGTDLEKLKPTIPKDSLTTIKNLFSEKILEKSLWARGEYRPFSERCGIPSRQALVLANGDVHPCNIVEYTHQPIMGNLLESSLEEVWFNDRWNRYRIENHTKCSLCPMNLHTYITLRERNNSSSSLKAWYRALTPQKIYDLHLENLIHSYIWKTKSRLKRYSFFRRSHEDFHSSKKR